MDVSSQRVQDRNHFPDGKNILEANMKYAAHVLASMLILASLAAAAPLPGTQKLVTQVPFQFTVGNSVVPAGECMIESSGVSEQAIVIHNRAGKVHTVSKTMPDEARTSATRYSLTFHKYGDVYFLTGINLAGRRTFYKLPVSSRERELQLAHVSVSEQTVLASLQ